MEKINVAICDDNEEVIGIMLSSIKSAFGKHNIEINAQTFNSAASLNKSMTGCVYDLLFLDIEMPKIDGVKFGKELRKRNDTTEIIYVSAREDRMFDVFEIHPFGFVRKSNFLNDIDKVIKDYINARKMTRGKTITVRAKSGIINIAVSSIKYIEGYGKAQLFHISGKPEPLSVNCTMNKLETEFEAFGFIRVHKGMLVNYKFISCIGTEVELTDGKNLPLSRRNITAIKGKYMSLLNAEGSVTI